MEKRCQLKLFWFVTTRWRLWNVTEAIAGQSGGNLTSWVSVCECVCYIYKTVCVSVRVCVWCVRTLANLINIDIIGSS